MSRFKDLSRRLVATCVILVAAGAVIVPATVHGDPVQNPIILTSPANGECVDTPTPTLTWQPRRHADQYKLKLFQDYPDREVLVVPYPLVVFGTYNTSWTTPYLDNGSQFHWGVKGSNEYHGEGGYGDGPWSETWYFYTCY